jgi:hypothetical protein
MYNFILPKYLRSCPSKEDLTFPLFDFGESNVMNLRNSNWVQSHHKVRVVNESYEETVQMKSLRGYKMVRFSNRIYICGGVEELEQEDSGNKGILKSPCFQFCTNSSLMIRKSDMTSQRQYMAVIGIQPSIPLNGQCEFYPR